ncbi:phage major capsid protein, HK97 family [Sphingomonas gellani]|uniref:Phage major capsid protein, HK97 family n=1 Tax=Sphingomonas gellani TaxID=1166340 RepID=A0A1H7Y4G5_9SPHN|nr:phage major capsid protein [Sphingomonas gellani]SEM40764.1 phage major capsid protein, HK97 family [Sphingomonas gellani]
MADLNDIASLASAFEEFKNTNDSRIAQIESKGSADVLTTEKLERLNEVVAGLQSTVTDVAKKSNRPGATVNADEDAHAKAFNGFMRKGIDSNLEALEQKAITNTGGTPEGANGGYLLPKQVEAGLFTQLEYLSPIRALASVVQVSTDDYRFLSNLHGTEAGWVGETDARPETATPTLSETRVPMGEIYANPGVSQRALDDLSVNVEALLTEEVARVFAIKENAAFIAGDGVNKPKGILATDGIAQVKTGVAANLPANADFLFSMIYGLASPYRQNARFACASSTMASVRTLKDSTGNYLWQPSLVAGQPSTLAGYAVTELGEMDAVAAGKLPMIFGDFKQGYLIADRIGVRVLRDPFTKKPFVLFYSTKRLGGMVKDKQAFITLKVSA